MSASTVMPAQAQGSSPYRRMFKRKNSLIVVIHCVDLAQTRRNVRIAFHEGADGIFLINHDIDSSVLLDIYRGIRAELPSFWIGINFLDLLPSDALIVLPREAAGVSGFWTDHGGISEMNADPDLVARNLACERAKDVFWNTRLYFGSVAFKYQPPVRDFGKVAELAAPYMDVIVTSGPKTGEPPAISKIQAMRKTIGNHPLAIASGMTVENAMPYMGLVDCFMVATGISDSHTELNPKKVKEFSRLVGH